MSCSSLFEDGAPEESSLGSAVMSLFAEDSGPAFDAVNAETTADGRELDAAASRCLFSFVRVSTMADVTLESCGADEYGEQ